MQKVKNYMIAYKGYVKSEQEKLQAMKDSNVYSQDYIVDQEKKMRQALEAKKQEYLKEINERIDSKLSSIKKPDTSTAEYQVAVSNIFTKVQLIGGRLTTKLLSEILAPAVEKQDIGTVEAVRSFVEGLADFPGGDPAKRQLLECVPRFSDATGLLENARSEITRAINDPGFGSGSMNADVTMYYLDQSGVFDL